MVQPVTDLLSTTEALGVLGLGPTDAAAASTKGTLLAGAISGISEVLAQRVGPIAYSTIVAELHDGGVSRIYVNSRPVSSVTQVVEYDGTTAGTLTAQTNTSQTSTDYIANLNNGLIERRDTNAASRFPAGRLNVSISYVAGRVATAYGTLTPVRFKDAASLMLKNYWRTYENSIMQVNEFDVPIAQFPRFTVPNAVKEMLAADWQAGSGQGD